MTTMTSSLVATWLVALALLESGMTDSTCVSRAPVLSNACVLQGSLQVFSNPRHLPVTADICNIVYDKRDFQQQPAVRYLDAEEGEIYTVIMLDPDAPGRPQGQYFLHWIQANIPGEELKIGSLKGSQEIASYIRPIPPEGSGLHRYMIFVYRHLGADARITHRVKKHDRPFFSLREYLSHLRRIGVRLCGPLSGVQYRSGFGMCS